MRINDRSKTDFDRAKIKLTGHFDRRTTGRYFEPCATERKRGNLGNCSTFHKALPQAKKCCQHVPYFKLSVQSLCTQLLGCCTTLKYFGLFYNGLLIEQIKRRARSNGAGNGVSKGSCQHCRAIYTREIMRAIFLATICTNGKHVIRCEWLV